MIMNKVLKNSFIGILCIFAIFYWIYSGLKSETEKNNNYVETEDNSDLILKFINKDTCILFDSLIQNSYISYSDTTNITNILKNQATHPISIDEIIDYNTHTFLSLSYNKNSLNNYKTFLKNNDIFNSWDSINTSLTTNYNFSVSELASYINQVGFFTSDSSNYFYIKSDEPYNIISLLHLLKDSNSVKSYNKLKINNLNSFLAGPLFTNKINYYKTLGEFCIFSSDTSSLYNLLNSKKHFSENLTFIQYKNKQHSEYSLNYYSDITQKSDTSIKILSYQLRGEQNGVIANFNIFNFNKTEDSIGKTTIDSTQVESITNEKDIIDQIVEETQNNQQANNLGEITYYLSQGESFRQATVKLKEKLEINGYDYNKVKSDHIYLILKNTGDKLNWNTAVNIYLDKKQPSEGDYFYMQKFYY